jgi:DNA helicase-2/ATP-dependent DNA helicase PcrA
MSRWLKGLNPEQREAVEHFEGPVLVLAGAGSGKTRVITHRIARLIERGVPPESILAVTFTNKAAGEMRERLGRMLGPPARGVTLSTFHSLGLMMLREELGRQRNGGRFVIYDTGDQLACLRGLVRRLRLRRTYDLEAILARISAWKNAFVAPDALPESQDEYAQVAAIFYPAYEEALGALAAVDFDDLVVRPTRLMESSAACRGRWAARFGWVLVDEYQDTNGSQLRMLQAIAGQHRNLCVVGDDDQAIYGWRGAEVRHILEFPRVFAPCKQVALERNYRSIGSVLELANRVIAQNTRRHAKSLVATREQGPVVKLVVLEDGDGEAAWVADQIEARVRQGRFQPGQVAVLYRSNRLSQGLETELRARRLPYRVLGGRSFFDRKEVKDLVAYLRVCQNPADAISLRRVVNFPPRGIGPATVERLSTWADEQGQPLFRAVERAEEILPPGDRALQPLKDFWGLIGRTARRLRDGADLVAGVRSLVDDIGLHGEVLDTTSSGEAAERRWAGVAGLLDGVQAYGQRAERPTLRDFLAQITLVDTEKDKDDEGDGARVTLCTLHGAKGLEWPCVFLVGVEEGILPHDRVLNPSLSDLDSADLAEERRLCYVGVTRARDELVLTRAARRLLFGKPRDRAPSRFVAELPADVLEVEDCSAPLDLSDAKAHLARIRALLGAAGTE